MERTVVIINVTKQHLIVRCGSITVSPEVTSKRYIFHFYKSRVYVNLL